MSDQYYRTSLTWTYDLISPMFLFQPNLNNGIIKWKNLKKLMQKYNSNLIHKKIKYILNCINLFSSLYFELDGGF